MQLHELKTDPELFDDAYYGERTFEVRFNDRNFQTRDILWLRRTQYTGEQMRSGSPLIYCGRSITAIVISVSSGGYGLKEGWCILGIKIINKTDAY